MSDSSEPGDWELDYINRQERLVEGAYFHPKKRYLVHFMVYRAPEHRQALFLVWHFDSLKPVIETTGIAEEGIADGLLRIRQFLGVTPLPEEVGG